MPNLIGQSLGRYHILEQLGEGGMATVYKARDTRLERDVAIKIIRRDVFGSSLINQMLRRFEREAKSLAKLSHPNIVKIMDYGEYESAPYLVMEYLPGGTLKGRLAKGRMAWEDAVRLLLPIAQALAYAHSNGIVHRDIKPSNILITHSGDPMLSDFGIAKILEGETTTELTATGAGIGTPEYMAPEQGMGQADERADIYSLGVVLYQMITGHVPYRADTPMAVLLKKTTEPLPRPIQYVPDLPGAVENVLIKSLARDPINRYQTTREFVAALQRLLESKPAVVTVTLPAANAAYDRTEVAPRPVVKRSNNWVWIAGGAGVLIFLLICVIGGFVLASNLTIGGRASPEPTRTPIGAAPTPTSAREAPTATEIVLPPTIPSATPVPYVPPTYTPTASLADPADFVRWYFHALWSERDYEYYWNNCMTKSFQEHSPKTYDEYVRWADSMQEIEVQGVDVLQNDGRSASVRVKLIFHLKSGSTASYISNPLSYDLTWNSNTGTWMFDYH